MIKRARFIIQLADCKMIVFCFINQVKPIQEKWKTLQNFTKLYKTLPWNYQTLQDFTNGLNLPGSFFFKTTRPSLDPHFKAMRGLASRL